MSERLTIHESDYGSHNFHVDQCGDELHVTLTYPPYRDGGKDLGQCRYIVADQESVRASDGIRVHFDFERNGYVIEQASRFEWEPDDDVCDPDWQEVAFIPAWGRQEARD